MLLEAGADPSATTWNDDSVIYERDEDQRVRLHANFVIQFTLLLDPKKEEIHDLEKAEKIQDWHDCQAEAQKMQLDDPLLREFLLKIDEVNLAGHLNNPGVRKGLETGQYEEEYPTYGDLIKSKYNKGIELWKMQELTTSLKSTDLTQVKSKGVQSIV